jgi:hypothetical protein
MLGVGLTVLAADGFGADGFGEDGVETLLAGGLDWVAFGGAGAVSGFLGWGWAVLMAGVALPLLGSGLAAGSVGVGSVFTALGAVVSAFSFLGVGWAVLAGLASFVLGKTGSLTTDGVGFWAGVEGVSGFAVGVVGALVTVGSGAAFPGGTSAGFWGSVGIGGLLGAVDGLGVSESVWAGTSLS